MQLLFLLGSAVCAMSAAVEAERFFPFHHMHEMIESLLASAKCSTNADCNDVNMPYCTELFGQGFCTPFQECSADSDCNGSLPYCTSVGQRSVCTPFQACSADSDCSNNGTPNCRQLVFGRSFCTV